MAECWRVRVRRVGSMKAGKEEEPVTFRGLLEGWGEWIWGWVEIWKDSPSLLRESGLTEGVSRALTLWQS